MGFRGGWIPLDMNPFQILVPCIVFAFFTFRTDYRHFISSPCQRRSFQPHPPVKRNRQVLYNDQYPSANAIVFLHSLHIPIKAYKINQNLLGSFHCENLLKFRIAISHHYYFSMFNNIFKAIYHQF